MAVNVQFVVFWVIASFNVVVRNKRFGGSPTPLITHSNPENGGSTTSEILVSNYRAKLRFLNLNLCTSNVTQRRCAFTPSLIQ